jgi:hypothetical protein
MAVIVMPYSLVVHSIPNLECGRISCMEKAVTSIVQGRKRLRVGLSQWEQHKVTRVHSKLSML